jgi:predicted transcriptional regulator YdeE
MVKEKVAPFSVIGISVRTTNENGQAASDIANLWQRFFSENIMAKIPNKADHEIFLVYTDYEKDHTHPYTVILGCKVKELMIIPSGMMGKKIEGGTYIRFSPKGRLVDIVINEWIKIWSSGIDRLFTADFEIYGPKSRDPENAEVDIYIAI